MVSFCPLPTLYHGIQTLSTVETRWCEDGEIVGQFFVFKPNVATFPAQPLKCIHAFRALHAVKVESETTTSSFDESDIQKSGMQFRGGIEPKMQ